MRLRLRLGVFDECFDETCLMGFLFLRGVHASKLAFDLAEGGKIGRVSVDPLVLNRVSNDGSSGDREALDRRKSGIYVICAAFCLFTG